MGRCVAAAPAAVRSDPLSHIRVRASPTHPSPPYHVLVVTHTSLYVHNARNSITYCSLWYWPLRTYASGPAPRVWILSHPLYDPYPHTFLYACLYTRRPFSSHKATHRSPALVALCGADRCVTTLAGQRLGSGSQASCLVIHTLTSLC